MYKVFIENRPIFFANTKLEFKNAYFIETKSIKDIRIDLVTKFDEIDTDQPIVLLAKNPEKEFKRLFEFYEKIDAAGGIVRRKKRFLFIKRNGFWDIPKGKVDDGESIEVAAIREIEEECGVFGASLNVPICITYHTYDYKGRPSLKKTHWYLLDYDGKKDTVVQEEEGITKAKWFKRKDIDKVRKNTFGTIIDVLDQFEWMMDLDSIE